MSERDWFAERYLSGAELWGDNFGEAEIAQWFADEREGYAGLTGEQGSAESYGYNGLNEYLGFRKLPRQRFPYALGVGSSYGGEFLPILDMIDQITILEPSRRLRSDSLHGVVLDYVDPTPSGLMPFDSARFDLVLCLSVLHHIPNVTQVVSEIGRVLAPGSWALIREPVISMGDWRTERKQGITARERGIPRHILEEVVSTAGLRIRSSVFCMSPLTARIGRLLHANPYASRAGVLLDRALALGTAWNYRYHATAAWQKLRPSGVFIVAQRKTR